METSGVDVETTRREYEAIQAATDRPFGVNLPILFLRQNEEMERAILAWVIDHGVRFVTTSAGNPRRHVQQLKDAGVIVYYAVPTLDAALKAEDAGVDGLIVEGAESAGIRNQEEVNTFVLLQAVRERVDLPIVAASVDGTMLLPRPPRAKFRTLRTPAAMEFAEALANPESNSAPSRLSNVIEGLYIGGDVDNTMGTAGQSAALVHEIKPVKAIIDDTVAGFWREIDRLAAMRPRA